MGAFTSMLLLDQFKPQANVGRETGIVASSPLGALKIASKLEAFLAAKPGDYAKADFEACILLCINRYSKSEINEFIRMLPVYQLHKSFTPFAGIFISHLLNSSEHDNFKITLPRLEQPLDYLCYSNKKSIEFFGEVGDYFGKYMQNGFALLHGNAGHGLGKHMKGGTLAVDGSCDSEAGAYLQGGEIQITKDAEGCVGFCMRGGTIRVNGSLMFDWKDISGGNIFHGGRQVIQDGHRVWNGDYQGGVFNRTLGQAILEVLPELLGDKGHERMQQVQ